MKTFDEKLQAELDKLPFERGVDDSLYKDGVIDGFDLGARWAATQAKGGSGEDAVQQTHTAYEYLNERDVFTDLPTQKQIDIQEALRIAAKSHNYSTPPVTPQDEQLGVTRDGTPIHPDCFPKSTPSTHSEVGELNDKIENVFKRMGGKLFSDELTEVKYNQYKAEIFDAVFHYVNTPTKPVVTEEEISDAAEVFGKNCHGLPVTAERLNHQDSFIKGVRYYKKAILTKLNGEK